MCLRGSVVERFLGKEKVPSSILGGGLSLNWPDYSINNGKKEEV